MANCVFAPLLLKERFRTVPSQPITHLFTDPQLLRQRDLLGIFIAILGAVTVVLASNTSDVRLDPAGLLRAISQRAFIVFSCVYIIGAIVLAGLSEGKTGRSVVFVDVGLCAIFGEWVMVLADGWLNPWFVCFSGGFTVLSTKGISTLLTLEWIDMFTEWITYPVILVSESTCGSTRTYRFLLSRRS